MLWGWWGGVVLAVIVAEVMVVVLARRRRAAQDVSPGRDTEAGGLLGASTRTPFNLILLRRLRASM